MDAPWDACKVGFGIDDIDALHVWMDATDDGCDLLPAGWRLTEVSTVGARTVAVFDTTDIPLPTDGLAVRDILIAAGAIVPTQEC